MKQDVEALEAYFLSKSWLVEKHAERSVYRLFIPVASGQLAGYAYLRASKKFVFYLSAPFTISKHRSLDVAQALTRINQHLSLGNLEIDLQYGEIRFKMGHSFKGGALSIDLVDATIQRSVETVEAIWSLLLEMIAYHIDDKDIAQKLTGRLPTYPLDVESIAEVIRNKFDTEDWGFREFDPTMFRIIYVTDQDVTMFTHLVLDEESGAFYVLAPLVGNLSKESMKSVTEWLALANHNLWLGHFTLTNRNRRVAYNNALLLTDADVAADMIEDVVISAIGTAELYYDSLNAVVNHQMSPTDAIQMVRGT